MGLNILKYFFSKVFNSVISTHLKDILLLKKKLITTLVLDSVCFTISCMHFFLENTFPIS